MSTLNERIEKSIQDFVGRVTAIAQQAAIDTLQSALLTRNQRVMGRPVGSRGGKRTSDDLSALKDRFTAFVRANPGLRIEQINKKLGTSTRELALPIRQLVVDGIIKSRGQKRSTTYSVATSH